MREDEIERLFRLMDKIFKDGFTGGFMTNDGNDYSYSNYGYCHNNNILPNYIEKPKEKDIHDNLVDISEDGKQIYITIELRGVEKDDLIVTPKEDSISIQVMIDRKTLKGEWKLPSKVNPKSAKIDFKNCVLDVILKKKKGRKKHNEF